MKAIMVTDQAAKTAAPRAGRPIAQARLASSRDAQNALWQA
jgi:hypothetical protein